MTISADGSTMVSGSGDFTIKRWDANIGGCLDAFTGDAPFYCMAVVGNPVCAGDVAGHLHLFDFHLKAHPPPTAIL